MRERLQTLSRLGYLTKGVVYALVGWLAVRAALGMRGGATTGSEGAIRRIGSLDSFGKYLVLAVAVGLGAYAVWRIADAVADIEQRGRNFTAIMGRIGVAISGLSYAALAFYAGAIGIGATRGGAGGAAGSPKRAITQRLLATAWGPWLLGLVGAVVIGVAIHHFRDAIIAKFMDRFERARLTARARRAALWIGRFGIAARAVTFAIIGWFLIRAAIESNKNEVLGLGEALRVLAQQTSGTVLLAVIATGFMAYGVYCFLNARYRSFAYPR